MFYKNSIKIILIYFLYFRDLSVDKEFIVIFLKFFFSFSLSFKIKSEFETFFDNEPTEAFKWINLLDEDNSPQEEENSNNENDVEESNFFINPIIKNKKYINDACSIM